MDNLGGQWETSAPFSCISISDRGIRATVPAILKHSSAPEVVFKTVYHFHIPVSFAYMPDGDISVSSLN